MVTTGKTHTNHNGNGRLTKEKGEFKAFSKKKEDRLVNLQSFNQIHSSANKEKQASFNLIDWSRAGEFESRSMGLAYYGLPTYSMNDDPALRFLDPYDDPYKGRLINAFLFDPIINEAIRVRVSHLLGSATSINFYPDTGVIYDSDQAAKEALLEVLTDAEQKSLRDFLFKVETKICRLRTHLYPGVIQAFMGGRSALYYETAKAVNDYKLPEGTPIAIKPLHFSYLGQVRVDPQSWELESVEYKDNIFDKLKSADQINKGENYYVPVDRMIYFVREDEHTTPNDYYYGKSIIQPILSCSETLRYIIEEDLPELNKSQWAGSGFFEFAGMANEDIQTVLDQLTPGLRVGFNQPVKYTEIPQQGNANALIEQLSELMQFMLVKLKVPTFLMNREEITNRATTETISQVWQITTLEQDRDWLRESLQRQWYDKLIELKTGIKSFDLKYQVKLEFQQKIFSDMLSKSQGVVLLINAGVISRIEGREMLGLGPLDISIEGLSGLNPEDQRAVNEALAQMNQQALNQVQGANNNVSGFDLQTSNQQKKAQTLQGLMSSAMNISKKAPPLATQVPKKAVT